MPTLLRFVIALLSCGVLFAGIALLAIVEVVTGRPDGRALALGSLAICALVLPPMLAGVFASYWSWDGSARRRLRVSLVVLVVVQVAGAAGVILLSRTAIPAAIVLVVVAAALDPASVALGRLAKRLELRAGPGDTGAGADLADFRAQIRTGWRRGGIGAAIGLAVGVLISVALLAPLAASGAEVPRALVFIPAGTGLGASIGMLTVVLALARRVRDLLGGDYSGARRIGRAVIGKPEVLTDDEQARASRYAAVAPAWLRLQATQNLVNSLAVTTIAASSLLGLADDRVPGVAWLGGLIVAGLLVTVVAALVVLLQRVRRVRAYAAAHPA